MDATSSSLNAKQRRKLLRQQQYAQETIKQEQEEVQVKQEPSALVHVVKEEPNDQQQQLYTKERRRLARLAKQKTEVVTQGDGPTDVPPTETSTATSEATSSTDNSQLNAQERRLLKRQAKRKAEGVEEYKPPTKKQKKKKQTQGEDGDGDHKSIHLTLFVGQLPYRATEAMVRNHFEEAGEIKLRMLTDKKTKRFKGTAFIEVKDSKALGAALSRHHTLLQGRRINVEMTTSGGGNKSENRRNKIDLLRKKQSNVQVEKTKALIQKHIDGPEYKLKQEDVDDRMIDFLSWFDYETAKKALDEYNRCVSDRVNNRKAFFMGILKRFRQTDGVEPCSVVIVIHCKLNEEEEQRSQFDGKLARMGHAVLNQVKAPHVVVVGDVSELKAQSTKVDEEAGSHDLETRDIQCMRQSQHLRTQLIPEPSRRGSPEIIRRQLASSVQSRSVLVFLTSIPPAVALERVPLTTAPPHPLQLPASRSRPYPWRAIAIRSVHCSVQDRLAMTSSWPLFAAAELVTRECLSAANGSLPHVTRRISDFLDTLSRSGVFLAAIYRGDSERELSYLYQRDPSPLSQQMVRHSAAAGHDHVLQWLQEHEGNDNKSKNLWSDYNFNPIDEAAKSGQCSVLQWLHDNRSECYAGRAMSWAASNGHLEAVKWLHLKRTDVCGTYAMDFAAANGHLHVVQWLHSNRKEGCSTWAMDGAATNGHLQVVTWLHANRREGCTKAAIDGAAAHGRLQVVQFLLQTVRPQDEMQYFGWAFSAAVDNGHVDVAEWVYTTYQEHLSDSMLALALSAARDNGHYAMTQWLRLQQSELR